MRGAMASRAETSDRAHLDRLFRDIYAVIRRIPRGRVATYGQVAELAGIPGGARIAAAALKTSTPALRLPWQRVIGKAGKLRGRIAIHDPVGAAVQREPARARGRRRRRHRPRRARRVCGWLQSRIRPRRIASTTASVRVDAPSFIITPLT